MGLAEGLLKDKFAFSDAYKSPIPKTRKLLCFTAILPPFHVYALGHF